MKPTKSEVDAVVSRLSELSMLIGVPREDLLTFMRVLSRASWANVEFEPVEGVKFEFEGLFGSSIRLEITARRGNTTIIREYRIPDFLIRDGEKSPSPRPIRRAKKKARRKKSRKKKPPQDLDI
ncbi:hypothetical protein DRO32_02460 [Candidatus Bathyarchaeota archaeon]|nr:MAG: hypothetical protein DRO32_02460 [Candidatus Bathyarchaeota archaeon]